MHDVVFSSGWDTALIIVPFIGMTALSLFGLDERLASPKRTRKARRGFCELDRWGDPFLSDPDGRRSR